jgi:hypothetical protein
MAHLLELLMDDAQAWTAALSEPSATVRHQIRVDVSGGLAERHRQETAMTVEQIMQALARVKAVWPACKPDEAYARFLVVETLLIALDDADGGERADELWGELSDLECVMRRELRLLSRVRRYSEWAGSSLATFATDN